MSVLDDVDALVRPAFWHCPEYAMTIGPEVADLGILFGRTPNPEQQLLLDGSFGMDRNGRLAAFEVFVLAARQNLKTGFFEFRALGKALLLKRPLQIWTAHKESATDQAFDDFRNMIEHSAELSRRVRRTNEGKGSKEIEFVNGCRIVFRPRTGKAGQSMSADDVDLDEYFAVEPKHEGSLLPTMSTRANAQVGMASSAPHRDSDMQRTMMARGRAAAEGLSVEPRLLYAEWSPIRRTGVGLDGKPTYGPPPCKSATCKHSLEERGCIADDREVIKLANPSAGRTSAPAITWEYIASERRKLQGEALSEYFKERLSIGVEGGIVGSETIFGPPEVWKAGEVAEVADGVGAVALTMTADRKWVGLVGASVVEVEDEHDPEAEPSDRTLVAPILHTTDIALAIKELQRIQGDHDCVVVYDENGPAGSLADELEEADVAVEPVNLRQYAKATSKFYDGVTTDPPTILHLANADLDTHVAAASWKWVNDNRLIGRRDGNEALDTTLIEGAVLATEAAQAAGTFNIY